jgi:hypothetical protein
LSAFLPVHIISYYTDHIENTVSNISVVVCVCVLLCRKNVFTEIYVATVVSYTFAVGENRDVQVTR